MYNDLDYPWDLDDLFIKTNKFLKKKDPSKLKKTITVQFLGGYTCDILYNWSKIFCKYYNTELIINENSWGPAFSQLNSNVDVDLFICLNSSNDLIHSGSRNTEDFNLKTISNNYVEFVSNAAKKRKFVACTYFDTNAIQFPYVKKKNDLITKFNKLNLFLNQMSKKYNNMIMISLDFLSSISNQHIYSTLRDWYNFGQVLNIYGSMLLAHKISRIVTSLYNEPKKVLIVDLDNTIWGGIIGDDGVENLKIGQETAEGRIYSDIQKYILELKRRGVLLAIVSKNDYKIAKEGFENPHMLLKWSDFIIKKINWNDKSKNIIEISKTLNLGIDSFVFIDDNPAEREEVKLSLPMILIPDCGENPEDFVTSLSLLEPFNNLSVLTSEDLSRNKSYKKEMIRNKLELSSVNKSYFLKKLQIKVLVNLATKDKVKRVCQLNNKTNQFNFTGINFTEEEIIKRINNKDNCVLLASVLDKFGNYGITTVIFIKIRENIATIENWVMSCRVFAKDVEIAFFQSVMKYLTKHNINLVKGRFIPTKKNTVISKLYETLKFKKENNDIFVLTDQDFSEIDKLPHYCEIVFEN